MQIDTFHGCKHVINIGYSDPRRENEVVARNRGSIRVGCTYFVQFNLSRDGNYRYAKSNLIHSNHDPETEILIPRHVKWSDLASLVQRIANSPSRSLDAFQLLTELNEFE